MIKIGLTSFNEHGSLLNKNKLTLGEYASVFPVVEMNTSFYGIKPKSVSKKWVQETPSEFKFIVKAFKAMTKHANWEDYYQSEEDMDQAFFEFISPLVDTNRLEAILCQFSSYFTCTKENVNYLRRLRQRFPGLPLAIELRSDSWYQADFQDKMLQFMRDHHLSLVIVDEPQVPIHSVPFLKEVTSESLVYVRLHGRQKAHWTTEDLDWRKKRNLYCYNSAELSQLAQEVSDLPGKNKVVIFNNNSAGDAAPNALLFKEMLNIDYIGLNPSQTTLF